MQFHKRGDFGSETVLAKGTHSALAPKLINKVADVDNSVYSVLVSASSERSPQPKHVRAVC